MLIKEDEMSKRINNPLNLINQMKNGSLGNNKRNSAMSLFIRPERIDKQIESSLNPFDKNNKTAEVKVSAVPAVESINTDELIPEGDARIKLSLAHDKALDVMTKAIDIAGAKLDDISPSKLPGMITAMSKVVGNIRQEKIERDKINKGQDVHLHFYCPEQKKMEAYEVIEVAG